MLPLVKVKVSNRKAPEQVAQFFRREIVVRQTRLAPVERDKGSWLDLLEPTALILELGHRHIDQPIWLEDTSDLLHKRADLCQPPMMDDLEGEHGIEEGIGKGQTGKDVVLGKLCLQPRLRKLLPRQSEASWGYVYAVHRKVVLGKGEHMSAAAASQIEDRLGAALVQQVGQSSRVFVGLREDQPLAGEHALPDL